MKKEKSSKSNTIGRKIWLCVGWFTPALLAIILLLLYPHMPWVTEHIFVRGISHFLISTIGYVISLIPFSLTEILILLAFVSVIFIVVSLIVSGILTLIRKIQKKPKKDSGKSAEEEKAEELAMLRICGWVICSCFLFYAVCYGGSNYRYSAADLCGIETKEYSAKQLYTLCCDLADRAAVIREDLEEDENGCMKQTESLYSTLGHAGDGYKVLEEEYPFLASPVVRAKSVMCSHYWSYTGIEGVYFPLFMESNANTDIPDYAMLSSAAHELSHLRGFAKEDESNFFGCLSCFHHPSKEYQYSGLMSAYVYCSNQLYDEDINLWKKAEKHVSKKMLKDFESYNTYWSQFNGAIQDVSLSFNDAMIKVRGVKEGSESYNLVVDLLVNAYLQDKLF